MRTPAILSALALMLGQASAAKVSGELKKWHKVTFSFDGPSTSETSSPNPFTDYRLNVTFRHAGSGKSYVVPGHYAADGNAADTSATSGRVWRAHFAPDETGTWSYEASFRSGSNIATSTGSGSSAGFFDGETGNFTVQSSDKGGRDFRGKGRLQYVGKHHLRFAESGEFFMKAGVDSPENFLAYEDFDGDFKNDGNDDDLVKDWAPHAGDWNSGDPVWQGSKGKGIIGAINYLAGEGLNVFSFLTMNINGDDNNVFPYLAFGERSRLDVSRLDQWEIVFAHGTRMGMYLHFKTQETENELLLDGGNVGNQRKLYYRELVSRFGHHLALNWNLGEEINDASTSQKVAWAQYFHDIDPYHHLIVIHNGDSHYELMGDASELTGFSRQENAENFSDTFGDIKNYIDRSRAAGKPWVVACDEPGDSRLSLRPDNDAGSSHLNARRDALWATAMAGGAGIEFYFGYDKPHSDLTCNDFRSRDDFWDYCRHFLTFFNHPEVGFENMTNRNSLVSSSGSNGNRCLAQDGVAYVVQLRSGGSHTLNLADASGNFRVRWFNPRSGGSLVSGPTLSGGGTRSLGSPPSSNSEDWIALVTTDGGGTPTNAAPVANAGSDRSVQLSGTSVSLALSGSASDDGLPSGSTLVTQWSRVSGPAAVTFGNASSPNSTATFTEAGTYVLRLTASDGSLSDSDDVTVSVSASPDPGGGTAVLPTDDAYTENGANRNNTGLRVENATRVRVSYLRFDLSGLGGSPSSAVLRLTEHDDDSPSALTLRLSAGTSSNWSETTITGANAPAKGAQVAAVTQEVDDGDSVEFDVSSAITGPGIYTFILETDATYRDVSFGSKENADAALRPQLILGGSGAANAAPVVNAGTDQAITLQGGSATTNLQAAASDDGLPAGSSLQFTWSTISGPAAVSFSAPDAKTTNATFSQAGAYVLRFAASDGILSGSDDVTVQVNPPTAVNAAPVVDAGADRAATLAGSSVDVTLSGAVSDDGLPQGGTLVHEWTRVSGPAAVTFVDPAALATTARFSEIGTYVLRLTADDGELADSDELTVSVVSGGSGSSQTFAPTHDCYLQNGSNVNNDQLRVESSSSRKRVTYLQFDLRGLPSAPGSAILRFKEGDDVSSGTMTLRLHAANSNSWSEGSLSASNAPGKGAQLDSFTGNIGSGDAVEFDVLPAISAGGIYSFILEADASSLDVAFASAESSSTGDRPQLIVIHQAGSAPALLEGRESIAPLPAPRLFKTEDAQIRLETLGVPGKRYIVERSPDLVEWTVVGTSEADVDGQLLFSDPTPLVERGFYRLRD